MSDGPAQKRAANETVVAPLTQVRRTQPPLATTTTLRAVSMEAYEDDAPPTAAASFAISSTSGTIVAPPSSATRTRIQGLNGLTAPGIDAPKVRLIAGKEIPGTRYRIVRWLGEGGMGVVYEAEHVDIERRVALKVLRFDLSQQPRMARVFRDEARAASRLGSKHIVEVYDFGELPDGRLFFAMELLDGHDLVPSESTPTMAPGRCIGILRQVCKGLDVAHRAGVVHRDVKPENIIVTREDGRDDVVKLVDFGISAMLAAGPSDPGRVVGTPHYMAPEQVLGQAFDARLDIYALGCMAYELLTGHPPFGGDTIDALLFAHIEQKPRRPSEIHPDLGIPHALEAVIMRCLEKDPALRYTDMADLEAALCEAQIEAKLTTPWDDLPLPNLLDLERREWLLREMPSQLETIRSGHRRFVWPAVAGASALMTAALTALFIIGFKPSTMQLDQIDALTRKARMAASRAEWVVPQVDPQAPTAYSTIVELEHLEGRADPLGDDAAVELREEFAATLVRQADKLWDDGATRIARETYFWALTFDPRHPHALERAGTTGATLADFAERAREGRFTEAERIIAAAITTATEDDPTKKAELARALWASAADIELSFAAEEILVQASRRAALPERPEAPALAPAEPEELEAPPVEEKSSPISQPPPQVTKRARRESPQQHLGESLRDPSKSKALAQAGVDALRSGRRSEASKLFHQAIAHDRRNGVALMGLSDIYFDTGEDRKAALYAERAVSAAPTNESYRIKLGDAYYKALRYKDALVQYERAAKLGSSRASSRIAKVRDKLGE